MAALSTRYLDSMDRFHRAPVANYRSPKKAHLNKFIDHMDMWAENLGRVAEIGGHAANIGRIGAGLRGQPIHAIRCAQAERGFGEVASFTSAIRPLKPWKRLVTGETFFETDATKEFVRESGGKPVVRPAHEIAQDILILTYRTLSPISYANRFKDFLGKHAFGMGLTTMFAIAGTILIEAGVKIKELATKAAGDMAARIRALISCILDLAALPFGFGFGMNGRPEVAIVGSAITIVANGFYLYDQAITYGAK